MTTRLRIVEVGTVRLPPDEFGADLRVEEREDTADEAQEAVNRAVAVIAKLAQETAGIRLTTGHHDVGRDAKAKQWTATQHLTLTATEVSSLLHAVGRHQRDGVLLNGFWGRLLPRTQQDSRDEAMRLALRALQRRAQAAATELGLAVTGYRRLYVGEDEYNAGGGAYRASRSARREVPTFLPEEEEVTVTVTAIVELAPPP